VDLLGIAVFALVALGLFFVFYQGHEPVRQAVGALYWMIILIRVTAATTRFAVAPGAPLLRLPPISDRTARKLYHRIVWVVASVIVAVLLLDLLEEFGVEEGLFLLVGQIVSLLVIGLAIGIIWHDRRGIADMIEPAADADDEPSGPVKRLLAANWHILATCYLAGIYVFSTFQLLLTGHRSTAPAVTSIAVLIAIPFVDWMMQGGLRRLLRAPAKAAPETIPEMGQETLSATPGETVPVGGDAAAAVGPTEAEPDAAESEYFGVLLRNFRVVLAIVVAVALGEIWNIDMRGAAAAGVGETVANAIFDIVITLVLASAIWGIIKTAISRQLPEKKAGAGPGAEGEAVEGGDPGGTGGTRLETLLPLFRKFLFVILVVIVGMIILSELGVDIGPLIAGAGIVGIAIGFGAQTLVRDIVSGVFFLIEDAFRVGEYIDIGGGIRGMVEDISIRSFRLRHHNGPIHTVPFGGVNTLTNFSRDWVIMKLELRLPFETDIEKVRKIVK
jgi:small-conductance mechanosensitive channel